MNGRLAVLANRYAGRPVLLLPRAAEDLAERIRGLDTSPRRHGLDAILRAFRGRSARQPMAMEDDDGPPPVPMHVRAAYAPLYIGEAEDIGFCWALKDGVALMQADTALMDRGEDFCGTVYHGYDTLLAGMREAAADERVKGIFIRMACPGGVVAGGLAELSAWMRDNRQAAGGKPIHVYADMACSAAYWIAAQADRIVAPRVGLVGSIGAVIVHEDYSEALAQFGLKVTAIQFGLKKTYGAWWEALGPEAQADLQAEIDQCGRDFVAEVTAGRPQLTPEALLATEAGVFMGAHDEPARSGEQLGFVDEIAGEEAAFAALAAQVSDPQSLGTLPVAAPGGRAASIPEKDKPMASTAQPKPGAASALEAARLAVRQAQVNLARAQAEAAGGEGDDNATDTGGDETVAGAEGQDTVAGAEGQDTVSGGGADDTVPDDEAIAASAEAKAHPVLALAAIQSKQTLAQFKASVAAVAGQPKGQLAAAMEGSKRLGADGPKPASEASRLDPNAIYGARKARAGGR